MNRISKSREKFWLSRLSLSLGYLLIFCTARPVVAAAATINVTNPTDLPIAFTCNLRQAIVAHDEKKQPFPSNCAAGDGDDTIVIKRFPGDRILDFGSPLRAIENGTVTIKPVESTSVCVRLRQAAYMTVNKGATLNLEGIGIVVNGAEFLSPIDNNGGTLSIFPHSGNLLCSFSNQKGRDRKTSLGGVLNNRNGGTATITANFENSSAADKGGAIYIENGSVTIKGGAFNSNDAPRGGAIYVNSGATLNIASNNFSINLNSAGTSGGAIYSTGGNVTIARSDFSNKPTSVSISSNKADDGGAIFASGGQLSIDGIQFLGNSATGSGGAIRLSDLLPPNPASVSRTYFRHNSASVKGASIYSTGASTLTLSADIFSRDKGGIYVDDLGTLSIINSTFLGTFALLDGVTIASGTADVTFSTILLSNLSGLVSGFNLSNSILREVRCNPNVADKGGNLEFQSQISGAECPSGNVQDPKLDPSFLKDNGGPTPTIALLAHSPAIDQIPLGDCLDLSNNALTIDQRGATRPDDSESACDIGAYESGSTTPSLIPHGTTF
jgi:predicted outer membrane repeat protein